MTDAGRLESEVARRWQAMLASICAGEDVPPGLRLRTEGMMEALVLLGHAPEELQQAMADAYREALGRTLDDDLGSDWHEGCPFPEVPYFMQRAPVHRGGKD